MNHLGTQTIETERLILRRFTPEDAAPMYRNWASDPEVTKYLTWPTHSDPSVSAWVVDSWVSDYARRDSYSWAIELKELGQPIGSIAVVSLKEDVGSAEIGYCIGKAWWGRGIMTEALESVMDFLFARVGARRVEARHDPNNPASGVVMRKCDMVYEGTLRQADRNNQGICDAAVYAALASDRKNG